VGEGAHGPAVGRAGTHDHPLSQPVTDPRDQEIGLDVGHPEGGDVHPRDDIGKPGLVVLRDPAAVRGDLAGGVDRLEILFPGFGLPLPDGLRREGQAVEVGGLHDVEVDDDEALEARANQEIEHGAVAPGARHEDPCPADGIDERIAEIDDPPLPVNQILPHGFQYFPGS